MNTKSRLGISRMVNWTEPFDGQFGLGYRIHNLATEGRPSVIGLSLEGRRPGHFDTEYLRSLGIQTADVPNLEFYNGLTRGDFELEKSINWNGRYTEANFSEDGSYLKYSSTVAGRTQTQVRYWKPLSPVEFEHITDKLRDVLSSSSQ